MRRIKLVVEYDGRGFLGWQRQKEGKTVQGIIESAIWSVVGKHLDEPVTLQVAGRTDAGVHALAQVSHVDLPDGVTIDPDRLMAGINFHIRDHGAAIVEAAVMEGDWHARFSAKRRHYRYHILSRRAPPALRTGRVWHVPVALDVDAMQEGANHLIGTYDFTTFRHSHCQAKSPIKTLEYFHVFARDDEILFETGSRSFLHHQVRSMVGSLKLVGSGNWSPDQIREALEARDRSALGMNAPPDGLYFLSVDYDE